MEPNPNEPIKKFNENGNGNNNGHKHHSNSKRDSYCWKYNKVHAHMEKIADLNTNAHIVVQKVTQLVTATKNMEEKAMINKRKGKVHLQLLKTDN